MLPGSPAFYAYKNVNKTVEILDNVAWSLGSHRLTMGGGVLPKLRESVIMTTGPNVLLATLELKTYGIKLELLS